MIPLPNMQMPLKNAHYTCRYELDQRPNRDLVNLNQELYRVIPQILGSSANIPLDPDGLPDAVHYYLLYASALVHGAADAALTLVLHNLGREARLHERGIFECWVRSKFFSENPDLAKLALRASMFHEREMLDQVGYARDSDRYREVDRCCKEIEKRYPEASRFREPSLGQIVRSGSDADQRFYAFHYRVPSQMAHASFAGSGGVITEQGVQFDSRDRDPDITLAFIVIYLLAFVDLLEAHLGKGEWLPAIEQFKERWSRLQPTLKMAQQS